MGPPRLYGEGMGVTRGKRAFGDLRDFRKCNKSSYLGAGDCWEREVGFQGREMCCETSLCSVNGLLLKPGLVMKSWIKIQFGRRLLST